MISLILDDRQCNFVLNSQHFESTDWLCLFVYYKNIIVFYLLLNFNKLLFV